MISICKMRFGAHLFGTATPESDTDLKGVFVPDAETILALENREVVNTRHRGASHAEHVDVEMFSLKRYLASLGEGQTNAIDMLFAPDGFHVERPHPLWQEIQANRGRFLSRRANASIGYARQQASKYGVRPERLEAVRDARDTFRVLVRNHGTQARIGGAEAALEGLRTRHPEYVRFVDLDLPSKVVVKHLEVCQRRVPCTAALKTGLDIYDRQLDEYGERVKRALLTDGTDWKSLSHAVRVSREGIEFFETGQVTLPRPDAAYLLAIKTGQVPRQQVLDEIEALVDKVETAAARSTLPAEPDQAFVREFVINAHRHAVEGRLVSIAQLRAAPARRDAGAER